MNRKALATKTVVASVLYYIITGLFGFIDRKVFAVYLGQEILGLNGLLVSVISMLSLLELGVAGSIGFSLYKPLEEDDRGQIKGIILLLGRFYRYIGFAVALVGTALIPLLPVLVKSSLPLSYVRAAYLLFLADTVLTYFTSYRRILLQASQRDYINKNTDIIAFALVSLLKILLIVVWKAYLLSLAVKIVFTLIANLYLYRYTGTAFPYLRDDALRGGVSEETKKLISDNVRALFVIKLSTYLVFGTDNLLLSFFVGIEAVAVYQSYTVIINLVNSLFNNVFSYIIANIGSYILSRSKEETYDLYKKIFFANFAICTYTSTALLVLLNPFIRGVWLGENYVFAAPVVVILIFNNYSRFVTQGTEAFRGAAGLYSPRPYIKYLALAEGAVNIVFSILFAKGLNMGVTGVFLGTTVSTLVSTVSLPWIVYKFLFGRPLREYWGKYFQYLLIFLACALGSLWLYTALESAHVLLNLLLGLVISAVIPIAVIAALYRKSEEWQYFYRLVMAVLQNVRQKLPGAKQR